MKDWRKILLNCLNRMIGITSCFQAWYFEINSTDVRSSFNKIISRKKTGGLLAMLMAKVTFSNIPSVRHYRSFQPLGMSWTFRQILRYDDGKEKKWRIQRGWLRTARQACVGNGHSVNTLLSKPSLTITKLSEATHWSKYGRRKIFHSRQHGHRTWYRTDENGKLTFRDWR